MNRAERRALAKKGGAEAFVRNARDVVAEHVNVEATVTTYTLAAWVLHSVFGFGEARLLKFLDGMQCSAEDINRGKTKAKNIRENLNALYPRLADAWEVRL